jgi:hypothetical protein
MKLGRSYTPEQRRALSQKVRATMADPEVRKRISDRTNEGMLAASDLAPELTALRDAWRVARPAVRKRFLAEVMAELVEAADVGRA